MIHVAAPQERPHTPDKSGYAAIVILLRLTTSHWPCAAFSHE